MNYQWSSKPRAVRVTVKESGQVQEHCSVAQAARALGIFPEQAHSMLSGRSGKRSAYRLEYVDGQPSRAVMA